MFLQVEAQETWHQVKVFLGHQQVYLFYHYRNPTNDLESYIQVFFLLYWAQVWTINEINIYQIFFSTASKSSQEIVIIYYYYYYYYGLASCHLGGQFCY